MIRLLINIFSALLTLLTILIIPACSHQYVAMPDDPRYAPIIPDIAATPVPKGGSLFIADGGLSLYQDVKAHRIGDILTVQLSESTSSDKEAKSNFKKEYSNTTPASTIFGLAAPNIKFLGRLPFLKSIINPDRTSLDLANLQQTIAPKTNFTGEADTEQSNNLTGDITVTVAQVLPNKNLVIKGEKWINLTQGSEYIRLSGIVRPEDIGPNNVIVSTKIANARITYSGAGTIHNANVPGWLSKFFNSPLYPF